MADRITRRDILKASAFGAISATVGRPWNAMAGPFERQQGAHLVPADKKLDPAWLASLTERGTEPWVSDKSALQKIGMPVGGLFAGCVYLGGDGRLWNWDVFNHYQVGCTERPNGVVFEGRKLNVLEGANYVEPIQPTGPLDFSISIGGRQMDSSGWESVRFLGQYPVGTVEYSDDASPVAVRLEAFSPFVPHDVARSSYPATVLRYTVTNKTDSDAKLPITIGLVHPCLVFDATDELVARRAEVVGDDVVFFKADKKQFVANRPDIVFESWEHGTYKDWEVSGTAFGNRPRHKTDIAAYQGDVGMSGEWTVNTHQTRNGEDVVQADAHTGTLTSRQFTVPRNYLNFLIGGGNHPGKTCINLVVDGVVVRTATGFNTNQLKPAFFDVREFFGKTARVQIVDEETGGWGNIGIDRIVLSDRVLMDEIEERGDYGSFSIAVQSGGPIELRALSDRRFSIDAVLNVPKRYSKSVTVVLAWHFPNVSIPSFGKKRRWYAGQWGDALEVVQDVLHNLDELARLTLLWRDTWYDSTLPYWFLDRTFANVSTLATSTCYRFDDGRFWFWEGVGCCHGTCTHVWSYAQATARVFPEVERYLREEIDFGRFFHEDTGAIDYRAEFGQSVAHDGQCGCIMRAYREHTMTQDDAFLKKNYPNIKKAMQFIIAQDGGGDGILEGSQYNTLDAAWYGPMAWVSSMYLGALRACQAMAKEMGDSEFASTCSAIISKGSQKIVSDLFDGDYFVHRPDPAHPEANATGVGCHIDQIYGQSWCHWMGLERVVPEQESRKAMASLYKYNFAPDVGVYRRGMQVVKGGRWYAMPGEAGLLMTTFPKGGADRATGAGQDAWAAMYFNECMSGFEYQAAAHMVAEGLVTEGLAVTRAIHDRYAPHKRNPYNEVECSDHYGRAMASFGVFWNLCGYRVHGPHRKFSASPMLPGSFKAAFLDAFGWGTCEDGARKYLYSTGP